MPGAKTPGICADKPHVAPLPASLARPYLFKRLYLFLRKWKERAGRGAKNQGMASVRAFIAVEIGRGVAARLGTLQRQLQEGGTDAAWVNPESMHITLKFLDDVPSQQLPAISAALMDIASRRPAFALTVAGLGAFPNPDHPRVLWVGVTDGANELMALAREVEQACVALGLPRAEQPFHPHITLGRVRSGTGIGALSRKIRRGDPALYGHTRISEVRLMRSDLLPEGAKHTLLAGVPLQE
jgi:RNA 2',3'-cyclic 3'-phosphodiesterase